VTAGGEHIEHRSLDIALLRMTVGSDSTGCALTLLGVMRQEDVWGSETAGSYDTPGSGMFAPEVLGRTVDRLAELAGEGPALEFAIDTGRVAVPLAQRGVPTARLRQRQPRAARMTVRYHRTGPPTGDHLRDGP
jgi:hypothetical protein